MVTVVHIIIEVGHYLDEDHNSTGDVYNHTMVYVRAGVTEQAARCFNSEKIFMS